MKDVRKLVPRTPPEGLLEWAAERHKELDQDGLLIETEWAQDWSLEVMLDEWAENRKVRAIRATCSACKESGLLWRGRDGRGEWGFIHPGTWTEGEGGEVCADGDKTTCPWCGESVIVRRKADVRKKGWFVAAERHVMSASVLGKDRLLTLTGWTVQRRITAAAGRQLVAIPAEAYVFSAEDCAQLMGWVNSYSGTTGYSIQYTRSWRQPKDWVERWGSERGVFGLTPELVADSCLPHCKLDRYMAEPRRHAARYPVAWLRLCQKHPNAESLLVHGLPDVLDELIAEQTAEPDWKKNKRGELELPEIRWSETRPAQMLGLTRDELAMARSRCWGTLFWRLFTQAKDAGETLTDADIAHAFYLGDENVLDLVGRGPVGKSLRYLLRQIERAGVEPEDEDPQPEGVIDVSILLDYWRMAELTGRDLADPDVRWPEDLLEAHDRMSDAVTQFEARELASKFRIRRKQLARYAFQWRGLLIRPAASQRELVAEGDALHHCVGTYGAENFTNNLAMCTTEAEKQELALNVLTQGPLKGVYDAWAKANPELVEGRDATLELQTATAELGTGLAPVITDLTELATNVVNWVAGMGNIDDVFTMIVGGIAALGAIKAIDMITGLATSLMTMDKAMLMAKASTGLAFVAFGLLFSLLMQAAGVWDSMSDAEKVVTILGAVTAAAFAAALAVGAFQSALSLGVAVVAITAGIAAMMMAINSAEKRVNQMNAATQQSLSPSTYGGVSGRSASIPALATGAVIPPNGEFLAVLGDQKKGRNLEAPENLIRQIVREESGGGLSGTLTIRPAPGLTRYLAYELKREDARAGTPLVEGTRR